MDGQYRKDIYPGLAVAIILKKDQRSGTLTYGIVKSILTSAPYHSRGIKVKLEDGQIGRVAAFVDDEDLL
ncbi:YwbE family protein [Chitinophaga sp. S165]|uniref:YwbE family protein n=1 Tax=Chitinophaga sp. S165 TaxID=2135462 RepID=UPI000D70E47E|nr:YwbE family protein [Chitinophaga sp. S165]PWV56085.1 putative repeat protein (TIGR03833 family) [Chitinophaga sp. S165]